MAKAAIPDIKFDPDAVVSGSAKKALESASATKGDLYYADPDQLREIPGFNARIETPDYLEHIEQIALSIKANGFYPNKPLGGFAGKEGDHDVIYVTDGHSRRRAITRARELGAEIDKIPVVLKPPGTSIEDLTVALVQDNEGRPLTALEKAIVAARLKGFGWPNTQIAEKFGCTDRYVEDLLHLAAAPPKVRNLVIGGKVSPTEAIKQVRKNPSKAAAVLIGAVEAAAASGKKRATAKHVVAAAKPAAPERFNFGWTKDQEVPTEEILPVGRIGSGWWEFVDDEKASVRILKDVTITVSLTAAEPTTVSADEEITVDNPAAAPDGGEAPPPSQDSGEPAPAAPAAPAKAAKGKAAAKKPAAKKTTAAKKPAAKPKAPAAAKKDADEFAGL